MLQRLVFLKSKDCPQIHTHFTEVTAGDIFHFMPEVKWFSRGCGDVFGTHLSPYLDIQA